MAAFPVRIERMIVSRPANKQMPAATAAGEEQAAVAAMGNQLRTKGDYRETRCSARRT
jgi:hypothetical protein